MRLASRMITPVALSAGLLFAAGAVTHVAPAVSVHAGTISGTGQHDGLPFPDGARALAAGGDTFYLAVASHG
jgi:hypothetical protein